MALEVTFTNQSGGSAANLTLVSFMNDPAERGTVSLLSSSLASLILCVWAAVHLNLPKPSDSALLYIRRSLKWSFLAVFLPEILLWIAWRQYNSAKTLTRSVERHLAQGGPRQRHPWSATHSYYAGMGGFVIDTSSASTPFIPGPTRLVVTPQGIELLARCGSLPNISKKDIQDKSKSDAAGKILCCLQVGWMSLQILIRFALRLPVTLLEVHTLAHVLCAAIMYGLWWDKPRWILEPSQLESDRIEELCAFMFMASRISEDTQGRRHNAILRKFLTVNTEMSKLVFISRASYSPHWLLLGRRESYLDLPEEPAITVSRRPQVNSTSGIFVYRSAVEEPSGDKSESSIRHSAGILDPSLRAMERTRWHLASKAISRYPFLRRGVRQHTSSQAERNNEDLKPFSTELLVDHACNWPSGDLLRDESDWIMGIVLWLASSAYDAVHLAGWAEFFPTAKEAWMWRASSLYLIFSGMLWSSINVWKQVTGKELVLDSLVDGAGAMAHDLYHRSFDHSWWLSECRGENLPVG